MRRCPQQKFELILVAYLRLPTYDFLFVQLIFPDRKAGRKPLTSGMDARACCGFSLLVGSPAQLPLRAIPLLCAVSMRSKMVKLGRE